MTLRGVATEPVPGLAPEADADLETLRETARMREALRDKIMALREVRHLQAGRQMMMRREDPEGIAILEKIETLEAQIQEQNAALRALFEQDEEWKELQAEIERREAAVNDARRKMMDSIRARRQMEFEQQAEEPEARDES